MLVQTCNAHANQMEHVNQFGPDVQNYGFLGLDGNGNINNIPTEWMNQTIPQPALNISAFWLSKSGGLFGYNWTDPRTNSQPYTNQSNLALASTEANESYSVSYIEQNGSCQPLEVSQRTYLAPDSANQPADLSMGVFIPSIIHPDHTPDDLVCGDIYNVESGLFQAWSMGQH